MIKLGRVHRIHKSVMILIGRVQKVNLNYNDPNRKSTQSTHKVLWSYKKEYTKYT